MSFSPEVLDDLLKGCKTPEQMFGADGLLQQLTKALIERSLQAELTHHLGYEKHAADGDGSGNSRNGTTPKTIRGKRGQVRIEVPRDRDAEFEPRLIKKGQTRFDGQRLSGCCLCTRAACQCAKFRRTCTKSMAPRFRPI